MISKFLGLFIAIFLCSSSMIVANGEQALVPVSMVKDIARETAREVIKEQNAECGLHCILGRTAKAVSALTLPQILGISAGSAVLFGGLIWWKTYGATPADLKETMGELDSAARTDLDEAREELGSQIGAIDLDLQGVELRLGTMSSSISSVDEMLERHRLAQQRGFTGTSNAFQAMNGRSVGGFNTFGSNNYALFMGARTSNAALFGAQYLRMQALGTWAGV